MGVYDTVEVGGKTGQVKCWARSMQTFHAGDFVQLVDGEPTYDIAMREGGYLHVQDCVLEGWSNARRAEWCYDKYGALYTDATQGELAEVMNDPYLFPEMKE